MNELRRLLKSAGFVVEELYGDCLGGAFGESSTEQVWLARR